MATIKRNGTEIKLTDEEVRSILEEKHLEDLRYEIEEQLNLDEDNGFIRFDTWKECECAEYASAHDAREDFIEKCIEDALETEDIYGYSPTFHAPDIEGIVKDNAEYLGFWRGE